MNHEAFPFSRRNRSTLHYIRQLAREDSVHAIDHTKKNQELGAASGYEAGTRAGCRERAMIFVRRLKCLAAGWPRRLGAASTPSFIVRVYVRRSQKVKPNASAMFIQRSVVLFASTLGTRSPFVGPAY